MNYLETTRSGTFYYYRRVPKEIQHLFDSNVIRQSLKTKNVKHAQIIASKMNTEYEEKFFNARFNAVSFKTVKKLMLANTIAEWLNHKQESNVSKNSLREYKLTLDQFVSTTGNMPLESISRLHMTQYRESIKDRATSTINKNLQRLETFFKWCVDLGYLTINPALHLKIKSIANEREQKNIFTNDECVSLLNGLHLDQDKASHQMYEKSLIVYIAFYSGMRLNEIASLYMDDVYQIDDVWMMDVNKNTTDKKLKNKSSKRVVPIHQNIIDMGFVEYVQSKKGDRVFDSLKHHERNGYGHYVSDWFNGKKGYVGRTIEDIEKKSFHSIRANFIDQLYKKGINENLLADIVGHSHSTMTTNRYAKGSDVRRMLDVVNQISY